MKKIQNAKVRISAVSISLDDLLPNAGGNIFRLIRMAMVRALEIDSGKPPLVAHTSSDKATTLALQEILQGKLVFKNAILKV